ncbi:hypothetical protein SASPL_155369 [Salvia splendens]|uniref:Uncharacterized protein n=2 Tax=Salvia splendens TaxID=180675 RepID=A0A8X8W1R7_SALSN|nr:hypothetical protein SASPL_155369 [Salvia splendens]
MKKKRYLLVLIGPRMEAIAARPKHALGLVGNFYKRGFEPSYYSYDRITKAVHKVGSASEAEHPLMNKSVVPLPRPIDEAPAATFLPLRGVDGFSVHIIGFPESTTLVSACDIFGQFGTGKEIELQLRIYKVSHFIYTLGLNWLLQRKLLWFGFVKFGDAPAMKKAIEASPITIGGSETIVEIKRSRSYYEMHKGKFKLKDKLVGVRHVRSTTGNSRGAKIVDCDEADEAEPSGKIHRRSPRSAETNEAWETLKKSSKELRASVKDPLPDAIHNGLRQDKRQEVAENNSITIHNGYFGSSITCSSPFLTLILPRSAETNEAWEALKKSSKELRASVKDPLPDAIHNGLRQDKRQDVAENSNAEPRRQQFLHLSNSRL